MTLVNIAFRSHVRKSLASAVARSYSGSRSQVDHFVSGWNNDDAEKYKDTDNYCTQTFNKISEVGLSVFTKDLYDVLPSDESEGRPAHALMLRSHKLQEEEVHPSVRAIARCVRSQRQNGDDV
jgi:hypothetical protein